MANALPRSGVLTGTLVLRPSHMSVNWYPWTITTDLTNDLLAIMPLSLSYEIPADFNPVPAIMAAAEAQKLEALKYYQKRVAEINEACSRFLAIETDHLADNVLTEDDLQNGGF